MIGLAKGTYTPLTAPLTAAGPTLVSVFNESFSGDLAKWTPTTLGLENNAAAGYDAPVIAAGTLKLGGTTNSQYWFGSSLETVRSFDSRQVTEVKVDRVFLTGSGSAYRSSLSCWVKSDQAANNDNILGSKWTPSGMCPSPGQWLLAWSTPSWRRGISMNGSNRWTD